MMKSCSSSCARPWRTKPATFAAAEGIGLKSNCPGAVASQAVRVTTKILSVNAVWAAAFLAAGCLSAATVPAGTTLVVQTLDSISSTEAPGTRFSAQLAHKVVVGGKVVLPAGTKLVGKIETSRRMHASSDRLTVNLTGVMLGASAVPLKTVGAVSLEGYTTARGVSVSRGAYVVAAGRKIEFRLAQPLNI